MVSCLLYRLVHHSSPPGTTQEKPPLQHPPKRRHQQSRRHNFLPLRHRDAVLSPVTGGVFLSRGVPSVSRRQISPLGVVFLYRLLASSQLLLQPHHPRHQRTRDEDDVEAYRAAAGEVSASRA